MKIIQVADAIITKLLFPFFLANTAARPNRIGVVTHELTLPNSLLIHLVDGEGLEPPTPSV